MSDPACYGPLGLVSEKYISSNIKWESICGTHYCFAGKFSDFFFLDWNINRYWKRKHVHKYWRYYSFWAGHNPVRAHKLYWKTKGQILWQTICVGFWVFVVISSTYKPSFVSLPWLKELLEDCCVKSKFLMVVFHWKWNCSRTANHVSSESTLIGMWKNKNRSFFPETQGKPPKRHYYFNNFI